MRRLIAMSLLSLGLTGGAAMAAPWHGGGASHGSVVRGEHRGPERGLERGREGYGREGYGHAGYGREGVRVQGRSFRRDGGPGWRSRDRAWRGDRR